MKSLGPLIALMIALPASAQLQRAFVSAIAGNDTNDCSLVNPCRTFRHSVGAVASGGEVIPLDSGGYGSFTIDKPLTVAAPPGVQASVTIADPEVTAITITNAGSVALRGISVSVLSTAQNALGISHLNSGQLRIDSCSVFGGRYGIATSGNAMTVSNSVVAGVSYGINAEVADSSHQVYVLIDRTKISGCANSGVIGWERSNVTLRNSSLFNNGTAVKVISVAADSSARMTIEGCVISGNVHGIFTEFVQGVGTGPALVRVSNSVIADNSGHALWTQFGGEIDSRGNNTVNGNALDETFTGTFSAH